MATCKKWPYLTVLIFDLLLTRCAARDPSCQIFDTGSTELFETCGHFSSISQLRTGIPRPQLTNPLFFVLADSHLESLPDDTFEQLLIRNLTFQKVTIGTYPVHHPNAFDALNATLRHISFGPNSTLPPSWNVLGEIALLETLSLEGQTVSIDRSWSALPRGLKRILIMKSDVAKLEEGALTSFVDLEVFMTTESGIGTFSWAVLPNPAPKLTTLRFEQNKLSEIPRGLTAEQFPALKDLHVELNPITEWDDSTLNVLLQHPNRPNLVVGDVHCGCTIEPLRRIPRERLHGRCMSPENLKGHLISELTDRDLQCNN